MRDFNNYKLFTLKNSKLHPAKTNEILGYISQNLFNSTSSSLANSNFKSSEQFKLLMILIFDKVNILVSKINKVVARIRMTFKDSTSRPSMNVESEKLPNVTIKNEKAEQLKDINNHNRHDSNKNPIEELQSLRLDLDIDSSMPQFTKSDSEDVWTSNVPESHTELLSNTKKRRKKNNKSKKEICITHYSVKLT